MLSLNFHLFSKLWRFLTTKWEEVLKAKDVVKCQRRQIVNCNIVKSSSSLSSTLAMGSLPKDDRRLLHTSCFGPVLNGSLLADFFRTTARGRLPILCVGVLPCYFRLSSCQETCLELLRRWRDRTFCRCHREQWNWQTDAKTLLLIFCKFGMSPPPAHSQGRQPGSGVGWSTIFILSATAGKHCFKV